MNIHTVGGVIEPHVRLNLHTPCIRFRSSGPKGSVIRSSFFSGHEYFFATKMHKLLHAFFKLENTTKKFSGEGLYHLPSPHSHWGGATPLKIGSSSPHTSNALKFRNWTGTAGAPVLARPSVCNHQAATLCWVKWQPCEISSGSNFETKEHYSCDRRSINLYQKLASNRMWLSIRKSHRQTLLGIIMYSYM